MTSFADTVHTYTADMTRPECPDCGRYVAQATDTPEIEWVGTCDAGHAFTYQLDDEEVDNED